jgi:hypothetical protein
MMIIEALNAKAREIFVAKVQFPRDTSAMKFAGKLTQSEGLQPKFGTK